MTDEKKATLHKCEALSSLGSVELRSATSENMKCSHLHAQLVRLIKPNVADIDNAHFRAELKSIVQRLEQNGIVTLHQVRCMRNRDVLSLKLNMGQRLLLKSLIRNSKQKPARCNSIGKTLIYIWCVTRMIYLPIAVGMQLLAHKELNTSG